MKKKLQPTMVELRCPANMNHIHANGTTGAPEIVSAAHVIRFMTRLLTKFEIKNPASAHLNYYISAETN